MKLTKKQIDLIRKNTPQALKGRQVSLFEELGYYMPVSANWSYRAGWAHAMIRTDRRHIEKQ